MWQSECFELTVTNPIADGTAVIACKFSHTRHTNHIGLMGELLFIKLSDGFHITFNARLNAELIGFDIDLAVFIPVIGRYVFIGVDLTVI